MDESKIRSNPLAKQAKAKCFSAKAGIEFEAITSEAGYPTVKIQIAPRDGKNIAWDQSIIVHADETELINLIAMLCGIYNEKIHIKRAKKGIEFERQPGHIYVRGTQGKESLISIPIPKGKCVIINCLMISQLKKQCFGIDSGMLMMAIKGALSLGP